MCAALVALEGMNFLDAMTFQDLCKLRAVSKDVKGSLCRSHWHWHNAATRALPDFDLTPALFLGAALQRCFQVMPLLLRLTSAKHYTMPRSVRATTPSTPQRVVQDHKIAVRCEADGLALAKRVEMQLQVAKTHLEGGGHFAKVFIAQMGSSIGEHASIIVLNDCQPIFSTPDVAPTPRRNSVHLYVMRALTRFGTDWRNLPRAFGFRRHGRIGSLGALPQCPSSHEWTLDRGARSMPSFCQAPEKRCAAKERCRDRHVVHPLSSQCQSTSCGRAQCD